MIWLTLILGILSLTLLTSGVYFWIQYAHSPQKAWRDRVLKLVREAQARLRTERNTLADLRREYEKKERTLREKAFAAHLRTIPVAALADYTGIGPATVSKLEDAGYGDLATLRDARLHVHGLGAKRLTDIRHAVQSLLQQALARFETGACREAVQLRAQREALERWYQETGLTTQARANALEAILHRTRDAATLARRVTFLQHFLQESHLLVPPAMLETPLPDLRGAVLAAEQKARAGPVEPKQQLRPPAGRTPASPGPTKARGPRNPDPVRPVSPAVRGAPKPLATASPIPEALPLESPPAQAWTTPAAARPAQEGDTEKPVLLVELTVQLTLAAARVEGALTPPFREVLEGQLLSRYQDDPALFNRARAFCAHYESAAIDVEQCLEQLARTLDPEQRVALLNFVSSTLVQAAGRIHQRTATFLEESARRLGVPAEGRTAKPALPTPHPAQEEPGKTREASAPKTVEKPPSSLNPTPYRTVLEIDPAVPLSADLIRRQFHRLAERFAAERFQGMGPEFEAMARSKREAIREAAETLLAPLGEKLEPARADVPQDLRHNPDLDDAFGA